MHSLKYITGTEDLDAIDLGILIISIDTCPHCQTFKTRTMPKLDSSLDVNILDCSIYINECKKFNPDSFPSILFVKDGQIRYPKFNKYIGENQILQWFQEQVKALE